MKTLHNPQYIPFPNKRNMFALGIISFMLLFSGCQTTDTPTTQTEEAGPNAFMVNVYGKVDSIAPGNTYNKAVLVMPHDKPCKEGTLSSNYDLGGISWGRIDKSGSYIALSAISGPPPCYTVFVVSYDYDTPNHPDIFHYDSVLAGPKVLNPKDFRSHLRIRSPLDSIQVDFVVNDSTKWAVQDSAK